MVVHLNPQLAALLDEEHVCRLDGRVVGVEVRRVLDVGKFGIGVAIGLVFDAGRFERVGVVVGRSDQQAAWAEVGARRREDGQQVGLRGHVGDCVVDEDGSERLTQPDGQHVPDVVDDAGVQPPRV